MNLPFRNILLSNMTSRPVLGRTIEYEVERKKREGTLINDSYLATSLQRKTALGVLFRVAQPGS